MYITKTVLSTLKSVSGTQFNFQKSQFAVSHIRQTAQNESTVPTYTLGAPATRTIRDWTPDPALIPVFTSALPGYTFTFEISVYQITDITNLKQPGADTL